MANSASPSDSPLNEWYGVSVSAVCLFDSCPQDLVFLYRARQSGLRRRGGIHPPEPPRILFALRFTQPGLPVRTPPRDSMGYIVNPGGFTEFPSYPRPVEPSTTNDPHLVFANSTTSSTSSSNVSPIQLAYDPAKNLQLWEEAVGFHPVGVCLLRGKRPPRDQHERCTPEEFYRPRR